MKTLRIAILGLSLAAMAACGGKNKDANTTPTNTGGDMGSSTDDSSTGGSMYGGDMYGGGGGDMGGNPCGD
jgi:hypothetical protein